MAKQINQIAMALGLLALAGANSTASAQDDPNPCGEGEGAANPCADSANAPAAAHHEASAGDHHSMVLPTGTIAVAGVLEVGLATNSFADPISITPDISYGAASNLDVGIYHSEHGLTGFWLREGTGLCLVGDHCANIYNGPVGLLANYSLKEGAMSLTAGGGLLVSNLNGDTILMDVKAGVKVRYALSEQLRIDAEPAITISANERSTFARDRLLLPVSVGYAIDSKLSAGVQTGLAGFLDKFSDSYMVPLNLGATYQVDSKLGVGAAFGFDNLLGKGGGTDARGLSLYAHYRI